MRRSGENHAPPSPPTPHTHKLPTLQPADPPPSPPRQQVHRARRYTLDAGSLVAALRNGRRGPWDDVRHLERVISRSTIPRVALPGTRISTFESVRTIGRS